ncbi:ABC transporter substrate-binding protein [Dactylosporangium sp. CA-092794]|uniref:ABC transporter substrate-binding protein n=1 Tax=Dactylosporangium sp. CA-092794 TaxID=3239929 RepID=UPI003D8F58A6
MALLTSACSGATEDTSTTKGSGGTLTVGMTLTDLPNLDTSYAFSVGGESMRWAGLSLYEGLTAFDLTSTDKIPGVIGGLAESWTASADATSYTFKLRSGVKFTDGTPWNADAAVFNIDRYVNKSAPQYSAGAAGVAGLFLGGVGSVKKVDEMTIEIDTPNHQPRAFLLQDLALLPMGSPTAIKAEGAGFSDKPVGTGPFMFESRVKGQSITLKRNPDYWKGAAKLDKLVLRFIPDQTARTAALRSGEVNFIETTAPDDIPDLKAQGFTVSQNAYSNVWRGVFDTTKAPWNDVRVRQAANLAVDREALATKVMSGTATAAYQVASAADPGFDAAIGEQYKYNPDKAKQLLAEAGYANGVKATMSYPSSGSGSMDGNSIAQYIQSDLAKVGITLDLVPMEFATLSAEQNSGKMPGGASVAAWSGTFVLPSLWAVVTSTSKLNVGKYSNPKADDLFTQAQAQADQAKQTELFRQLNMQVTTDAAWLPVLTDENPRAMSASVHDFVNPKSWFLDLRTTWVS